MPIEVLTGKRIALVVLTRTGLQSALRLQHELAADIHIYASQRALKTQECALDVEDRCIVTRFESLKATLAELWGSYEQLVLFFALGAAIRLVAPLLENKHVDPGVVVIDDAGRFAISMISGHLGGANELATRCADILGALPVVTTASEAQNTLAIDLLVQANGWYIEEASSLTSVTAAIVNGERVAVLQEVGTVALNEYTHSLPENIVYVTDMHEVTTKKFDALLILSDRLLEGLPDAMPTVICRPPTLVLGIGCRRGIPFAALNSWLQETLVENRIAFRSITTLATADIKADEEGLQELAQHYGWTLEVYSAADLKAVTTVPSPSESVQRLIGTPSVCEAAALLSSQGDELLVPKHKGEGMTMAVARRPRSNA